MQWVWVTLFVVLPIIAIVILIHMLVVGEFTYEKSAARKRLKQQQASCAVCQGSGSVLIHEPYDLGKVSLFNWCDPHRARYLSIRELELRALGDTLMRAGWADMSLQERADAHDSLIRKLQQRQPE